MKPRKKPDITKRKPPPPRINKQPMSITVRQESSLLNSRTYYLMVDTNQIAIADVLHHPIHGLVSHQPDPRESIQDEIRVRDIKGNVYRVLASECEWPHGSIPTQSGINI